ncbi:hypothetical protein Q3C01_25605 [Bradyrhizobium sp. UFLA05-109]
MEATITIDGHKLTEGQAMAVRVAITAFLLELKHDKKFADGLGVIGIAYQARLNEVMHIILNEAS